MSRWLHPWPMFCAWPGGSFNDLSLKRRKRLAKSIKDQQLSRWLEETQETLTHLFPPDVSGAMEASRAKRMDGLLSLASRAVSTSQSATRHSSGSNPHSFRGRRTEPYRQPFRGGRSWATSTRGRQSSFSRRGQHNSHSAPPTMRPTDQNAPPAIKTSTAPSMVGSQVGSSLSFSTNGKQSGHRKRFAI